MKIPTLALAALVSALGVGLLSATIHAQTFVDLDNVPIDRTVLPLQAPYNKPITELDVRDVKAPPVFQVRAPKDAPNVVIIMIDDLGFAGTSAFGGVMSTPTFDRLARGGLRYNQLHSTALCSPTRQALL